MGLRDAKPLLPRRPAGRGFSRAHARVIAVAASVGIVSTVALALGVTVPFGDVAPAPDSGDALTALAAGHRPLVIAGLASLAVAGQLACLGLLRIVRRTPVAPCSTRSPPPKLLPATAANAPAKLTRNWAFDVKAGSFTWGGAGSGQAPALPRDYAGFLEAVDSRDREAVRAALDQTIEDGAPYDVEMRLGSDGEGEQRVRMTGQMLPQGQYGVQRIVGVLVEQAAVNPPAMNVELLRRGLEQSPTPFAMTDVGGRVCYANPAFLAETGYGAQGLIGRRPVDFFRAAGAGSPLHDLVHRLSAGGSWCGVIGPRAESGEKGRAVMTVAPVRNDVGRITHLVATPSAADRGDAASLTPLASPSVQPRPPEERAQPPQRSVPPPPPPRCTLVDATGAASRVLALERVDEMIADAGAAGSAVTAIVLRLDGDCCRGSAAADTCTGCPAGMPGGGEGIAVQLTGAVPGESLLFRFSARDYAIVASTARAAGPDDALASAVREALTPPSDCERRSIPALGLARYPTDAGTAHALLQVAEAAAKVPPPTRHDAGVAVNAEPGRAGGTLLKARRLA